MIARFALPIAILGGVLTIALVLIVAVVVFGPNTHANIGAPDARFARVPTAEIGVSEHLTTPLTEAGRTELQGLGEDEQIARGRVLFFYNACSTCHGLRGGGTAVAPALAGEIDAEDFLDTLRRPPEGMPPYYEEHVSEDDAQAIFAFLEYLAAGGADGDE